MSDVAVTIQMTATGQVVIPAGDVMRLLEAKGLGSVAKALHDHIESQVLPQLAVVGGN